MVFQTTKFSCMDAALDGTSIYFAIVSVPVQNDCGSCSPQDMHGDGIGRVSLVDGTDEELALGVSGVSTGPRRVYLDGPDIFSVDPFVIAKLPKSALDGKHDFP